MIVLVGFMGAGKTQVGARLAQRLGTGFADADEVIVERAGRPIATIFAEDGEPFFRALEHETIADLLGDDTRIGVLSLGGGAAMHPGTRDLLRRSATTVHLRVGLAEALRRVGGDERRPMLRRPDLPDLHAARMQVYDVAADVTVDTDGLGLDDVVERVLTLLRDRTTALAASASDEGEGVGHG